MKIKSKYLFPFLIFMMIFILNACGIKSEETLTADKNFSGERMMDIIFDQETLSKVKDIEKFKLFLEENIESPLNYELYDELTEQEGGPYLRYRLYLPFNSIDDYINKSRGLYEKGNVKDNIEVNYESNVNLFQYTVNFTDNISVENLLRYITIRAQNSGYLNFTNVNSSWDETSYTAQIAGNTIINNQKEAPYKYETTEFIGPNSYLITTSKNGNKYNRVFNIIFKKSDYLKLENNWKDEIFKSTELIKLEQKEIEDKFGENYIIVSYAIENKDIDIIRRATEDLFGSNVQISLKSETGSNEFIEKYIVHEKVGENKYAPKAKVLSIYYIDKKEISEHESDLLGNIPINYEAAIYSNSKIFDLHGFTETVERQIVFDEVDIVTSINGKDNFTRSIIFNKKDEDEKFNIENSLVKYLDRNEIAYQDEDDKLIIKYFGDDFYSVNEVLFDNHPEISTKSESFFRYKIFFNEEMSFRDIKVKNIKYDIKGSELIPLENKDISIDGESIKSSIILSANRAFNSTIIFLLITILVIAIIAILLYIIKGEKSLSELFKKVQKGGKNEDE
ncbi:MAG: hypothetical protein Q4B23_04170 [Helcococcus sp.]|nr:hypothetical protein [Helcococcus sp.]